MTEKRFKAYGNNFIAIDDNVENKTYYLNEDVDRIVDLLNSLSDENEQLRQVVKQYRKTNKHLSELCADATRNGYLPPLDDFVKR